MRLNRMSRGRVLALWFAGWVALMLACLGIIVAWPDDAKAEICTQVGPLTYCGVIYHYSPDTGYNQPFGIRCMLGVPESGHSLFEGHSSKEFCRDTDEVHINVGEELWCKNNFSLSSGVTWQKVFDAAGWHKIQGDFKDGDGCTLRVD